MFVEFGYVGTNQSRLGQGIRHSTTDAQDWHPTSESLEQMAQKDGPLYMRHVDLAKAVHALQQLLKLFESPTKPRHAYTSYLLTGVS